LQSFLETYRCIYIHKRMVIHKVENEFQKQYDFTDILNLFDELYKQRYGRKLFDR
jgi:hypothetical protein